MKQKLVSIITPVYNSNKTIVKCINSVINQTYTNWELIIINDCSTDNSLEIIKEFSLKNYNIKIINETQNIQSLLARISGLKIAKGAYITFIDADDWMHEKALYSMINNIEATNADVVFGAWQRSFDNYGIIKSKVTNLYYNQLIEGVFNKDDIENKFGFSYFANHGLPVINWSKLYKRELFDPILEYPFPKMIKGTDLYLNLLVFQNVKKISFIKNIIIYYRDGGVSQKLIPNYLENVNELYILRKKILKNTSKEEKAIEFINKELSNTFFYHLVDCVFLENFSNNEIKNKYLEFKDYISYTDLIENIEKVEIYHKQFYFFLENNNFEKVYEIILNEIKKFRNKRRLINIIRKLILKL